MTAPAPVVTSLLRREASAVGKIVERVAWTFVQGFLGALSGSAVIDANGLSGAKKALLSAVTAGVAAAISLAKNLTAAQLKASTEGRLTVPLS